MTLGPAMAFTPDGLRTGGGAAEDAGAVAGGAATALQGAAALAGGAFGDVAGAELLAAALGRAREAHARTGAGVQVRHEALGQGSRTAATSGDQLIENSAAVARRGGAGPVTARME